MVDVILIFEVHQPYRLRRDFFWGKREYLKLGRKELHQHYFDSITDSGIFRRASEKCYLPSNNIILNAIDEHKQSSKEFKVAFSISGVFLEQCQRFQPDVLDTFKQLSDTGRVEFIGQTYYHSLSSLYPNKDEFKAQVEEHRNTLKTLLGYRPTVFENTELLYNNEIARTIEQMGFKGICTEGADRITGSNQPNYILKAKGTTDLKVILRNYKLTDDVGFRFSTRSWNEWPLTAGKYSSWLAQTQGQYVCIFLDYETFGEHHWPETGIHNFLRELPSEILSKQELKISTPSNVLANHTPVSTLDVPEHQTVSWADIERSTHSWIGNEMQWAFFSSVRNIEALVKEYGDKEFTKLWRYLQISDHLYYMYTSGGGPGVVHSYFSPYAKPFDAFINTQAVFMDFEHRLRAESLAANEPFHFQTQEGENRSIGLTALSLTGFQTCLYQAPLKSILFHSGRGDFAAWAEHSLRDMKLAQKIRDLSLTETNGEKYRSKLSRLIQNRIIQIKTYEAGNS